REAVDLLERLEALSPVPYHTELAADMSPAWKQALTDAKTASEMTSGHTFESYMQALGVAPAMYRPMIPETDDWVPAEPDYEAIHSEAWNLYPAEALEEDFWRRFGIDLAANGRAWLNNREFVEEWDFLGEPMASYDGENYYIYSRAIGGPIPRVYEPTL